MTQEQVAKAKELSENIGYIEDFLKYLAEQNNYISRLFLCEKVFRIAKDEVLPVFEKKLQELKNELDAM